MSMAQVSCPGCRRVFNPRGLSQHLSKTQRAHCCIVHAARQTPSIFQAVRNLDSSQTPAVILTPHGPSDANASDDAGILSLQ
jgi:hypothetical protein